MFLLDRCSYEKTSLEDILQPEYNNDDKKQKAEAMSAITLGAKGLRLFPSFFYELNGDVSLMGIELEIFCQPKLP